LSGTEVIIITTKQGNYKVPTVFLRLKRLSYEGNSKSSFLEPWKSKMLDIMTS
jgi:hypothetical protein